jgi:hypothetical protein
MHRKSADPAALRLRHIPALALRPPRCPCLPPKIKTHARFPSFSVAYLSQPRVRLLIIDNLKLSRSQERKMAKTAKKTATKTAKKPVAKVAKKAASAGVDVAIKLMQRKQGATRADLNEANFLRPAMAAIKAAEARGLKVRHPKKDGERITYFVSTE